MKWMYFWSGLTEIVISLVSTVIIFFMSFKIFMLLTRKIDELSELNNNNTAVSITLSSFLFGIMLLVYNAISPSIDTFRFIIESELNIFSVLLSILNIFIFFIISGVFAFIVIWLTILVFMILTRNINEWAEIKKNNISISIIIAALIICSALFMSHPLSTLLNGFIPSPAIIIAREKINESFINPAVITKGFIELLFSFIIVITAFFLSFKFFNFLTKKIDIVNELKSNNIAVAVLLASFIFGVLILLSSIIAPSNDIIQFALKSPKNKLINIIISIIKILLFFSGTSIFSFLILQFSMQLFMLFTRKIDEMNKIKNKNTAVAILLAVFIISVSIILHHGITTLLNTWTSSPKIEPGIF